MRGVRSRIRCLGWSGCGVILLAAVVVPNVRAALPGDAPTVDELKGRLSAAAVGDKVHLCVQIAQLQLAEADRLYSAADAEKAQPALADVVAFSELARDYAIQSHKNQKQTEIAVRGMTRKLNDLLHSLPHDEQAPVHDALNRLQRVRDDLLVAMFPKGSR
jgi:hypothetical protein